MKKHYIEVIKLWLDLNHLQAKEEQVEAFAEALAYSKVNWHYKRRLKND